MQDPYYKSLNWKGKLQWWWYYHTYNPLGLSWRLERLRQWEQRNYFMVGRTIAAMMFAIAGFFFLVTLGVI